MAPIVSSSKHVLSILLANEAGVLTRVSGLFSARGYNIESLVVAPTNDPAFSRMTIVTVGGDELAVQVIKQLHKLVDVVAVSDLGADRHVERETLLLKVACDGSAAERSQLGALAGEHGADVIECLSRACIMQMTASSRQIDYFIATMEKGRSILEIARSGVISLSCDDSTLEA